MTILYIVLGLLAVVVIAGLAMPSRYSIVRKQTIAAPPAAVHAFVGHLEKWPEWMPWEAEGPERHHRRAATRRPASARSNRGPLPRSGDGEVEFTACDENTGIAYDMAFLTKNKRAPAKASIRYVAAGDGTEVTWSMDGDLASMMPPVIRGLMKPLMSGMVGKNFARGLASLKEKVEAA